MLNYIYSLATDKKTGFIPGAIKFFLYILSLIYGIALKALILFYGLKPYRLNCKVISVGNITLGGTGKTSVVLLLARYLKDNGHRVAILTRGYKRKITDYKTMGDEPYMLKMNLKDIPVIVSADRIRAAKNALRNYSVDTVVLDDGFQQWRIKKDLEIVAIDATLPFGNGNLIPRGILREPVSALARADIIILTKTNLNPDNQKTKDFLKSVNPEGLILESVHCPLHFCKIDKPGELLNLGELGDKAVTLFSGIGAPESFEATIKNLGIKVGLSFKFRDHHSYTKEELDYIVRKSKEADIHTLVTTEKDAARLYELRITDCGLRVIYLHIEIKIIKNEQEFHNRLLGLYSH